MWRLGQQKLANIVPASELNRFFGVCSSAGSVPLSRVLGYMLQVLVLLLLCSPWEEAVSSEDQVDGL